MYRKQKSCNKDSEILLNRRKDVDIKIIITEQRVQNYILITYAEFVVSERYKNLRVKDTLRCQ